MTSSELAKVQLTTAAAVIPLAVTGTAGLEILQPLGVAALGGLAGAALVMLALVPAAYARFGAGTAGDTLGLEPESTEAIPGLGHHA
jgi:Cu/Ag efflux pump CusA